jgi:hypothetical protein
MSEKADPSTGVDGQAPDTALNRVATITAQIARLQHEHQIAVGQAIEGGTSWAALGAALGVSAQAPQAVPVAPLEPFHGRDLA